MKYNSKLWKLFFHFSNNTSRINLLRQGGVKIGKGCDINSDVVFGSEPYLISIGDNVRIAGGVKFVTHDGGLWVLRKNGRLKDADIFGRIFIGDNCHIGWNAIIMPNVTIGSNSIVACGAVVTKCFPDNCVIGGVPAKVIETIDEYENKNKDRCVHTKNMSSEEKRNFLFQYFGLEGNN